MVQKGKSAAAAARRPQQLPAEDVPPEELPAEEMSQEDQAEPALDRHIQARIGDNLRAMYDELLQQPVPDRFKDLLTQFEKQRDGKEHNR